MTRTKPALMALGLLAATPWILAAAQDLTASDAGTIVSITGTARQPQQPPFVVVTAGVETTGASASVAMTTNARSMERLRRRLEAGGIRPADIKTTQLHLSPHRDGSGNEIDGYTAVHGVRIIFRDIGRSGPVLDALVEAGANRINGPDLWWRPEETSAAARLAAIRDANRQAEFYARSLGLRVLRVRTMRDGGSHSSPNVVHRAAAAPPTEINPGEEVVTTTVTAEYELGR